MFLVYLFTIRFSITN